MPITFDGQVALITGAGNGLGRAYALELARRGAAVVVNDTGGAPDGEGRSSAAATAVVDEIAAGGGRAVPNFDSVATMVGGAAIVQTALDAYGRLDIVVCNAGIVRDSAMHNVREPDWDAVHGVHIKGTFTVLRAAWPVLRAQRYGRVILTGSGSGMWGMFGQSSYASAKTGVIGLMNCLKHEGLRYGITVNTIAPVALTRLLGTMPSGAQDGVKGRLGSPDLVGPVVGWFASRECTETGVTIEAGSGHFARVALVKGPGIRVPASATPDAEFVLEHWEEICSLEGAEPQWRPGVSVADYLAGAQASS